MTVFRSTITAIEYHLPATSEGAAEFARDNPEWPIEDVMSKTGVTRKWITAHDETALDLATRACEKLRASASLSGIDTLIFVTQSGEYVLPPSSCMLQARLGLDTQTKCFDLNLGCSGFVYALSVAASMIETTLSERVLIVCADTYSKYIDKHDRTTRPIFSDGAAAVVVSAAAEPVLGPFLFGTDGSLYDSIIVREGGARDTDLRSPKRLQMQGAKVFAFTMSTVVDSVSRLLAEADAGRAVDLFVFHQASGIVLDNLQRRLDIPEGKLFRNLDQLGNTVSATIPIALKQAATDGALQPGQTALLSGFGVGLSWGSCLLNWNGLE